MRRLFSFNPFDQNPKLRLVAGVGSLLAAVYFTGACISYFFTCKQDQHLVYHFMPRYIFVHNTGFQNHLGALGALVSDFFMRGQFGIFSLVLTFALALTGLKLLWPVARFKQVWPQVLFWLTWGSAATAFISHNLLHEAFPFGGAFGMMVSNWLSGFLGYIGCGIAFAFVFGIYIVYTYNYVPRFITEEAHTTDNSFRYEPIENNNGHGTYEPIGEKKTMPYETEASHKPFSLDSESAAYGQSLTDNLPFIPDSLINRFPKTFEVSEPYLKHVEPVTGEPLIPEEEFTLVNKELVKPVEELTIIEPEPIIAATPVIASTPIIEEPVLEITEPVTEELGEDTLEIVKPDVDDAAIAEEMQVMESPSGPYDPTLDLPRYKLPPVDLLVEYESGHITQGHNKDELLANRNQIVQTLRNYGIEIQENVKATVGPTVTLYEIIPAPGVRISKIKNLEDDIALSLAALGIRIIAPMPGKGTIGIEVPNQHKETVPLRGMLSSEKFQNTSMDLPIAFGKNIANELVLHDLTKMPHLLVAGATGQGKSVCINTILLSLLYKKHPAHLKFVLVDPKKVELSIYQTIEKHFLAKLPGEEEPIIVDNRKVINTVKALCIEMDNRYTMLKNAQCRNIKEYNEKFVKRRLSPDEGHFYLPYIVLVIDEFADLIMTAGKEIETPIARLAQLARAVGIHLIIATQRPSVNIITGTIKANFPARIAFKVSSKIDSRTILDAGGAEQLIGRGDMLLTVGSEMQRIQCAFVDTPEVERVTNFISNQQGYSDAFLLPEVVDENGEGGGNDFDPDERDEFFEEAARLIVNTRVGSTSMIQRKLKLGYNRAGRIMDQLESAGIVGGAQGSKPRDVIIRDEMSLDDLLDRMKHA